jgi:hypothetical protein
MWAFGEKSKAFHITVLYIERGVGSLYKNSRPALKSK